MDPRMRGDDMTDISNIKMDPAVKPALLQIFKKMKVLRADIRFCYPHSELVEELQGLA